MARLPLDDAGNAIPAMQLKNGGAHQIAIGATSARNSTPFTCKIASLYCDQPCYVAFGDETVEATASDHYFPAGIYYDFSLAGFGSAQSYDDANEERYTHIAVLQVSAGGMAYVSEKE